MSDISDVKDGSQGIDLARATTGLILTLIAGASTGLGGALVVLFDVTRKHIGQMESAAAGVMVFMSLVDLLPGAFEILGAQTTLFWFLGGGAVLFAIMHFVPEPEVDVDMGKSKSRKDVLVASMITAIGLTLHNFPEGIAVFLTSLQGTQLGVSLTLAVALHNIPEGAVVSLPIFYSTGSRTKAIGLALLTGMAEPAGMLIVYFFFVNSLPSEFALQCMLASVAGVMTFLSFFNLIPMAHSFLHDHKQTATYFILGFIFMGISTYLLEIIEDNSRFSENIDSMIRNMR